MKTIFRSFILIVCYFGFSLSALAQFTESFEGATFPPVGWASFDNGMGTVTSFTANTTAQSGAKAAFLPFAPGTPGAQDWLVSSTVSITPAYCNLVYWERRTTIGTSSSYSVLVSTSSQTATSTFTSVTTYTMLTTTYVRRVVNLSAYIGQTVYIGWCHTSPGSSSNYGWYIDNIS